MFLTLPSGLAPRVIRKVQCMEYRNRRRSVCQVNRTPSPCRSAPPALPGRLHPPSSPTFQVGPDSSFGLHGWTRVRQPIVEAIHGPCWPHVVRAGEAPGASSVQWPLRTIRTDTRVQLYPVLAPSPAHGAPRFSFNTEWSLSILTGLIKLG